MTAIPQGRTRRTGLLGAMCALVVTGTGLTGCGGDDPDAGTNGVGKLPAALASVEEAVREQLGTS